MENDSKMAGKIKAQITRFGHRISHGFQKPNRKFLVQMLYGIQASKDVKLSNISRSLNERIPLIKTEGRLSRNIGTQDLTERINGNLLVDAARRVSGDTVMALDISDIDKPYAKRMEHLALVRDGSTGEPRSSGYWLLEVLGADVEGEDIIPLYGELYSQEARDFRSENSEILAAVDRVNGAVGDRGIWTIDRGGDRGILFRGLLKRQLRFVVRLVGKRDLILRDGAKRKALKIAWGCHCPIRRELTIRREGKVRKKALSVGHVAVRLPFHDRWLWLVVVRGYGEQPLILVTNLEVDSVGALRVLEIYLTRWKCEESYRFIKQAYNLEDVRVLRYRGLRNIVVLVQAVFYFISVELGKKLKLNLLLKKLYEKAKRFFEIPDFRHYAIADGIYRVLFPSKTGIVPNPERKETGKQLPLPFAVHLS
jgi:hypothetical protein